MRLVLLAVVLISLVAVLTGCGGSGGDGDQLNPNIPILGSWQPISGTQDGVAAPMSTIFASVMDWDPAWTRGILQFTNSGALNVIGYKMSDDDLSHDATIDGSWTSATGVATTTVSGVTTAITYTTDPASANLLTATFSSGGHDYVTTWVKVVDLPGRDLQLVQTTDDPPVQKKWRASSITTIPAGTPADTLVTYFGLTAGSTNTVEIEFKADGTATLQEKAGDANAGAATDVKTGKWFTGGGELGLSTFVDTSPDKKTVFNSETRGYYTVVGDQLTTTFVDLETGQTVVIVWDLVAPLPV